MKLLFLNIRLFRLTCFFLLCFVFLGKILNAQNRITDSLLPNKITSLENYYKKEIGGYMRPFYGNAYTPNYQRAYGFPYWKTDTMLLGSIVYDYVIYNDILLQYDIANQLLITTEPQKDLLIAILSNNISSFSIEGHTFFNLKPNDSNNIIKKGFYERLMNSTYSLWAKHDKEFKLTLKSDELTGNYNIVNIYYIAVNEKFYRVENKKEILSILKDKKEFIRSFIKLNNLGFKSKIEEDLIKVMAYFNTLK